MSSTAETLKDNSLPTGSRGRHRVNNVIWPWLLVAMALFLNAARTLVDYEVPLLGIKPGSSRLPR